MNLCVFPNQPGVRSLGDENNYGLKKPRGQKIRGQKFGGKMHWKRGVQILLLL
jgi:hypothetical protein